MTIEGKWLAISEDLRQKLLHNVWCGKCKDVVEIVEYEVKGHELGLILEGKCKTCGHDVVRVVERR